MVTPTITVTRYESFADRASQRNGKEVGIATNFEKFEALVNGNSEGILNLNNEICLGYTDENGNFLLYEDVLKLFGIPILPFPTFYDPDTGEE